MTDHDLTRYALGAKPATSGPPVTGMWPSPSGEWVKHAEAAARIADLQRHLDELVGAAMRCDAAAWLRDSLQAAKDRDALRALAARIQSEQQPKESRDG